MVLESSGTRLEEILNASCDPIEQSVSEGPLALTDTGLLLSGRSDISLQAPCRVFMVARAFSGISEARAFSLSCFSLVGECVGLTLVASIHFSAS
jgi:hypothetical protein